MLFEKLNSENGRNFLFLSLANFGVLPIALLINIILARELGPSDFGSYSFFIAVISIFTTIFTFGFLQASGRAIVASSNKKRISQYYGAALSILIFLYIPMAISITIYMRLDSNIEDKSLSDLIPIVVVSSWVLFLKRYYDVLFQSDRRIKLLAFSKLAQPVLLLFFLILTFIVFKIEIDLHLAIVFFVTMHLFTAVVVFQRLKPDFTALKKRVKEIIIYNKRFGFHLYIGSILPLVLANLSSILISYNSNDNASVGFYTIALSLVTVIGVIPNTIATVLYKSFSKWNEIPFKVLGLTVLSASIVLLLLLATIELLVLSFYGEDFLPVKNLVLIMSVGLLMHGMADFFNRFLSANGQGRRVRNAAIITGFVLFFMNLILIPLYKDVGASISTTIAGFTYFIFIYVFYKRYTNSVN